MTEYRWYDNGKGRSVYRPVPVETRKARSDLSTPYFISDTLDDALYSGADGKQYTSKSALRSSYKAANNPRGIEFTEVGNDINFAPPKEIEISDSAIDASIQKAIAQCS